MLWVAIGQAPGLFLYAYVGTLGQLGLRFVRGETHPKLFEIVIWTGGLLLAFGVLSVLGRIALKWIREAQEATAAETPLVRDTSPEFVHYPHAR